MSSLSQTKKHGLLDILGLDRDGNYTDEELHKAYRSEALRIHPDKNPDDENATAKFQILRKAYEALITIPEQEKRATEKKATCSEASGFPEHRRSSYQSAWPRWRNTSEERPRWTSQHKLQLVRQMCHKL
jgi:DnaJ-class molecular chaperone